MIVIPSRYRPHLLKRVIDSYRSTEAAEPVTVLLDEDQVPDYRDIDYPDTWRIKSYSVCSACERHQKFFEEEPHHPYYGIMTDDGVPETPDWDRILAEAAQPGNLAWPADGITQNPCYLWIGGDLARSIGWVMPPGFKHFYADAVWGEVGKALGVLKPCLHVMIRHYHFLHGGVRDRTTQERPKGGKQEFAHFMAHELGPLVDRLQR